MNNEHWTWHLLVPDVFLTTLSRDSNGFVGGTLHLLVEPDPNVNYTITVHHSQLPLNSDQCDQTWDRSAVISFWRGKLRACSTSRDWLAAKPEESSPSSYSSGSSSSTSWATITSKITWIFRMYCLCFTMVFFFSLVSLPRKMTALIFKLSSIFPSLSCASLKHSSTIGLMCGKTMATSLSVNLS